MLWEPDDLLYIASCAKIAYDVDLNQKSIPSLGITIERILQDGDQQVRGFVGIWKKGAIVADSGTHSLRDLEIDADIVRMHYPIFGIDAEVAEGFMKEHREIWPEVFYFLRNLQPNMPIWITGHSLGGSLADLAAMETVRGCHVIPRIATFGSPRTLNKEGATAFNEQIPGAIRIVHDFDIVPRVPKAWWGFWHVDNLIHLSSAGKEEGATTSAIAELWTQARVVVNDLEGRSLECHKMENYIRAIERYSVTKRCAKTLAKIGAIGA